MLVPSDALPLATTSSTEVEALPAVVDVVAGLVLALDPAGALVVEAAAGLVLAGETLEAAVVEAAAGLVLAGETLEAAVVEAAAGLVLAGETLEAAGVEAAAGLVLAGETLAAAVVDAEPELSAFEGGALAPADVDALELLVVEAGALPAGEAPRSTDVDELEASVLDA